MKNRIPRKLKKQIPKGHYCYTSLWIDHVTFTQHVKPCKFYTHIHCKDKPEQLQDEVDKEFPDELVGWCKLISHEIDDQCKSCGINYGKP